MLQSFFISIINRIRYQFAFGFTRPKVYVKQPLKPSKTWPAVLMFILTVVSTSFFGFVMFGSLAGSIKFSVSLLFILGAHESGHYVAAKKWGIPSSLPYFIPFPNIIGTLGAVMRLKTPITNRKALFDIGIAGPLAGFVVALPILIIGISVSDVKVTVINNNSFVEGNSILYILLKYLVHGKLLPTFDIYSSLGNINNFFLILFGKNPRGQCLDIFVGPFAWAGWVGMLVTSLNLMPIGQLDGGHIVYALFPKAQAYLGKLFFVGLIFGSITLWKPWFMWVLLSFIFGVNHPPIYDNTDIGSKRKMLGYVAIIIFFLTFMPAPISVG